MTDCRIAAAGHPRDEGLLRVEPDRSGATRRALLATTSSGRRLYVPGRGDTGGPECLRQWGESVVAAIADAGDREALVDVGDLDAAVMQAVLDGLVEASERRGLRSLVLELPPDLADAAERALARSRVLASAVTLTRELVDARGNQCTPRVFSDAAGRVAAKSGLGFRVADEGRLRELGMGGLLAVGAGSAEPSLLVELWYAPDGSVTDSPPPGSVALVGKGVTFDSGGLSLKSAAAQVGMHTDNAGAATVLGAMSALGVLGVQVPVHAVLPVAENLPGTGSVRPGDVVRTHHGVAVEVVDTDFEGRVMLADALAWAASHRPRAAVDVATLTYQAVVALGPSVGAVIARDAALGSRVLAAAEAVGEPVWLLPWAPRYRDQLQSSAPGADLRNHPGTDTGRALTAALFLGEFVPEDIPWVHLDIAGPAVRGAGADALSTGFGVRTILELLSSWNGQPGPAGASGAAT